MLFLTLLLIRTVLDNHRQGACISISNNKRPQWPVLLFFPACVLLSSLLSSHNATAVKAATVLYAMCARVPRRGRLVSRLTSGLLVSRPFILGDSSPVTLRLPPIARHPARRLPPLTTSQQ
jgi:hypothetical protein